MSEYIVNRYAGILTKEDVRQMFDALTERWGGNQSEATRQCSLPHKTPYDWEKAGYLKLDTKRKVLDACLRTDFISTLDYLLKRSTDRTVDILLTILSAIYARAMECNSNEQFVDLLDRFGNLRAANRGSISDHIDDEVNDMLWLLREKAEEFNVPLPQRSIEDLSARELLDALPLMSDMYLNNPQEASVGAEMLDFPRDTMVRLWSTFQKLHPVERSLTEVSNLDNLYIKWHTGLRLATGTFGDTGWYVSDTGDKSWSGWTGKELTGSTTLYVGFGQPEIHPESPEVSKSFTEVHGFANP